MVFMSRMGTMRTSSTATAGRFALPTTLEKAKALVLRELNFYRVHVLAFTFIPLVFSGIMYGISTEYKISYIDCLFLCVTSMTVNGLATVDLSTLSVMQQVIMFWQMLIGSLVFVSIVMIVVRQHFFRLKFKHVIMEQRKQEKSLLQRTLSRVATTRTQPLSAIKRRFSTIVRPASNDQPEQTEQPKPDPSDPQDQSSAEDLHSHQPSPAPSYHQEKDNHQHKDKDKHKRKKGIDKNMIVRVGGGGMGMINPMGWYDERGTPGSSPKPLPDVIATDHHEAGSQSEVPRNRENSGLEGMQGPKATSRASALGLSIINEKDRRDDENPDQVFTDSPPPMDHNESAYAGGLQAEDMFPRSRTIAFNDEEDDGMDHQYHPRAYTTARDTGLPRSTTVRSTDLNRNPTVATSSGAFPRTYSVRPSISQRPDTKLSGFGGFPTPFELLRMGMERFFPKVSMKMSRTMTMPRTNSIAGRGTIASGANEGETKEAPYITFQAIVGRNSRFHGLTEEQMDELGGVEYRALRVLLIIVVAYFVLLQLGGFVIVAPYISAGGRYNDDVFDAQFKHVSPTWFSLFNVVSAFSNTGTSLSDASLIPFQTAYLMNFIMMFLIYAGNTAFPVMLRLTVWTIYKLCPKTSRLKETLKFLLDHPRRCFVYMFPSTQTWFLAILMLCLTLLDWVCFLVLDIGTPDIEEIPVGTRIAAAFVQSAAVRAAGFAIVPLASLAPAVKVLYVVMMYISIYPIALSVRSTNVYEERSLGLFEETDSADEDEPTTEKGAQAVAKYVGWHARRQLAFDIWWLAFALWLVCIIEKSRIDREDTATWFNVFNIIFELVSAYGTVGLSLGSPIANYSFVGTWSTLSKLVVIAVMIRGRHRGLPVAIDRAVMLPRDFTLAEEADLEERSRRLSRAESNLSRRMSGDTDVYRTHSRRTSLDTTRRSTANGITPIFENPSSGPARERGSWSEAGPAGPAGYGGPGGSGGILPTTPPHQIRSSFSNALPRTNTTTTSSSPRSLSFSLPTRPSVERSPIATKASLPTGALTPVEEGSLSRNPSRVEDEREQEPKTA